MPSSPERAPENFLERIPVVGRTLNYLVKHPIQSALNFLYITAGLAGLRHLGLFKHIPNTGGWSALRTAVDKPAEWSQNMYSNSITRFGTNVGGYPGWLSAPARTFTNATRDLFVPAAPPSGPPRP